MGVRKSQSSCSKKQGGLMRRAPYSVWLWREPYCMCPSYGPYIVLPGKHATTSLQAGDFVIFLVVRLKQPTLSKIIPRECWSQGHSEIQVSRMQLSPFSKLNVTCHPHLFILIPSYCQNNRSDAPYLTTNAAKICNGTPAFLSDFFCNFRGFG